MSEMSIKRVNPDTLPDTRAYGFSKMTIAPRNSELVFVSGLFGAKLGGELVEGYAAQLDQSFQNLRIALEAVGATPKDVLKITILSVDHDSAKQKLINEARLKFWPDLEHKPASTLIPVPRLALDGMLFEIDATAVLPS